MYDPLSDQHIPTQQPYPDSVWSATLDGISSHYPNQTPNVLLEDMTCDVLIVGAGFTGMSCALQLAQQNVNVILIDANQVGWGCSGRNAGFVLPSSGRLGFSQLQQRFGDDTANNVINEYIAGAKQLREFIEQQQLNVELSDGGYLKLAHNKTAMNRFQIDLEKLPSNLQSDYLLLSETQVSNHYIETNIAQKGGGSGGVFYRPGFAINPLKLALEMRKLLLEKHVTIFDNSVMHSYQATKSGVNVHVNQHQIHCKKLVLTTNAYTPNKVIKDFYPLQFPVLSSMMATPPLSSEQLSNLKQKATLFMDSRPLKYYYRLLPDNRLLFGGRGAIFGKNHDNQSIKENLLKALQQTFPALGSVSINKFWSGWVSVSQSELPYVGPLNNAQNVLFSFGYCGSGVAFTHLAGKRLAEQVMNISMPPLPIYNQQPKAFPMQAFRRIGLWGYYQWQALQNAIA